jgi:hypothetical protein
MVQLELEPQVLVAHKDHKDHKELLVQEQQVLVALLVQLALVV